MKVSSFLTAKLAFAIAVSMVAHAHALVYEGFDYDAEQDITTVTTTATNLGAWTSSGMVGTTDAMNLAFGALETGGGSLFVTTPVPPFHTWKFIDAPVTAGGAIADGSTLYGSFLFQFVGPGGGAGTGGFNTTNNFGISVGDFAGGDDITLQNRVRAFGSSPNVSRIGYEDENFAPMTSGNAIFDMTPYLFIGKWTNLGDASEATGWVLNQADFDAISGSPITEAALNANNVATNSDVEGNIAGSFGVGQFVKIGDFIGEIDIAYRVDEIRFADSLVGVLPVDADPTLEGDFDNDGDVDDDDLTGSPNGFNARFGVDLTGGDFLAWQRNYGLPQTPAAAVPEPSAGTLFILALLWTRRRRQSC